MRSRVLTSIPRTPTAPPAEGVRRSDEADRRLEPLPLRQRLAADGPALAGGVRTGVNASNVHALLEEIEDFKPDVAYPWDARRPGRAGLDGDAWSTS